MTSRKMHVAVERWPLIKPFVISRGIDYDAVVVVVTLTGADGKVGHGEATPYARYGESTDTVIADIEAARDAIEREADPDLAAVGLKGAAANAVDCALIDLAAKQAGQRAWTLLGEPDPVGLPVTATIILGDPGQMAADAATAPGSSLLKIKLGGGDGRDMARMEAVRAAVPGMRLICDANEGWSLEELVDYAPVLHRLGVEMVEQPLPAGRDQGLAGLSLPVKLCADESCHVAADVDGLIDRYDLVNVKLDKTGGLRGALELARAARARDMGVMVGCMLSTSLAMAPGIVAAQGAAYVDLDAPLALARDRAPPMTYERGLILPPPAELWG